MRLAALLSLSLFSVAGLACSAAGQNQAQGSGGSGGDSGDGGNGVGGEDLLTGPGTGPSANCSEASQLVYVLSEANELYSFRPDLKELVKIGTLGCDTAMLPNSMAIDRNATAWVNYVDGGFLDEIAGGLFKVSTADASCQPTAAASLPQDWYRLGMGFSTNGEGSDSETLYVTGTSGDSAPGLGKIDTTSGAHSKIGAFTGALAGQNAELTGTGDGRLYGFFTTTPVEVAELDRTTGAVLSSVPLPGVENPSAWAFSFWGGDFYLYTAPDPSSEPERTTNVTRYRPSTGEVDAAYMVNIGFRIVGAGVSTCAPLEPPK